MTEGTPLSFFGIDPRSTVLLRDGRIFRTGVDLELTRAALASDPVRSLVAEGSLVGTRIVEESPAEAMLEHPRITPFLYPGEWSFSMFRDAGLLTLRVQESLSTAGLELKDAHSYNVSFAGCRPVYIDFASIARTDGRYRFWRAGAEYTDAFLRILRIWSRTSRTCALSYVNSVWARREDEALVRHGRTFHKVRQRLGRAYDKALIGTAMMPEARAAAAAKAGMTEFKRDLALPMLRVLESMQRFGAHPFDVSRLRKLTNSIAAPVGATMWASYHQDLGLHAASTPRFERIIELVARSGASSVFEVGGNQGALAEALVRRNIVQSVVCSDADEHAIDRLYRRISAAGIERIVPLVRNVMMPDPIRCDQARQLQGDVVVALALTHHLLLTQNFRLDAVLGRIAAYGREYMIIEFMPKGLWYRGAGQPVPSWYTQEWFAEGLRAIGSIELVEQIEENRVVFMVKLSSQRVGHPQV